MPAEITPNTYAVDAILRAANRSLSHLAPALRGLATHLDERGSADNESGVGESGADTGAAEQGQADQFAGDVARFGQALVASGAAMASGWFAAVNHLAQPLLVGDCIKVSVTPPATEALVEAAGDFVTDSGAFSVGIEAAKIEFRPNPVGPEDTEVLVFVEPPVDSRLYEGTIRYLDQMTGQVLATETIQLDFRNPGSS